MKFSEVVAQALAWLQREERVSYRALKLEFDLSDDVLDALKEELIEVKEAAVEKDGKMLVWAGAAAAPEPEEGGKGEGETAQRPAPESRPLTRDATRETAERRLIGNWRENRQRNVRLMRK